MAALANGRSRVDFDAVKEMSVTAFLEQQLGVTAKKVGSGMRMSSCPACGDSDSGSTKLSLSKDDRTWHCFSCGERGSVLDAAMKLWNCSLVEAGEQLQGARSDFKPAKPKIDRSKALEEEEQKKARMRKIFDAIQQVTVEFEDEEVPLQYLVNTRKIPLGIVREGQRRGMVGFLPADPKKASDVLKSVVGEDLLREAEFWKPDNRLPGISYRPLVFFMPGLSSAEFRVCDAKPSENTIKSIRYGVLEYPYWWKGSDKQCMIVEGMIDMLSAVALGFNGHVLGLTGCNSFFPSWFEKAAKSHDLKRFVIALDNDIESDQNPGQKWAKKIKEVIDSQGTPCFIKAPEAGDINDILKLKSVG